MDIIFSGNYIRLNWTVMVEVVHYLAADSINIHSKIIIELSEKFGCVNVSCYNQIVASIEEIQNLC